jgi:FlaA1/EpsC-like NDP-sugar epimerase
MADGALRELMNVCDEIPVRMRALAPVNDVAGHVSGRLRDLRIEDLLPRKVATFDAAGPTVVDTYRGRRVMVTGAGGSIGSELARQLVRLEPSALLLLDHDENNLFETCSDVMHLGWPADRVADLMIDLRRPDDLRRVFAEQQPEVVLHAAAFKHVPVLEAHPLEAVENNVLATANLADLAMEFGVRTFVLISTDKAVQPTSIMGATKRAAELVIEQAAVGGLPASCVRFGNVLDSRGSVVPIFRRQIARGGPVTVTHRDATRYFMTIDEAAHLVLQAGSLDGTGRVFVLDMGAPVRIVDLAGDLIRLAGLREPEDIEIQVVGLRPGERLHERLTYDGTELTPTIFEGILAAPASAVGLETSMRLRSALRDAVVYRDEALARRVLAAEPIGMETEGAAEVVVDPARMRVAGVAVW